MDPNCVQALIFVNLFDIANFVIEKLVIDFHYMVSRCLGYQGVLIIKVS